MRPGTRPLRNGCGRADSFVHRVQPHHGLQVSAAAVPARSVRVACPVVDFGWPGIDVTLFGETFQWNILGYDAGPRRPAPTSAPTWWPWSSASASISRSSATWCSAARATCATQIVLVHPRVLRDHLHRQFHQLRLGGRGRPAGAGLSSTTSAPPVLNGGISMVIFFFVNKVIFPEGEARQV